MVRIAGMVVTLIFLVGSAMADDKHVQKYGIWTISCTGPRDIAPCALSATVMSDAGDDITIRITANESGKASIDCLVPHSVGLEAGVGLTTEPNRVRVFPYRTCNSEGCIATFAIDDQLSEALEAGTDVLIQYATLDRKAIDVPIASHGFNEAFAQFRVRNSRPSP